ncbi:MAG: NTP transferase domain-containing protein [Pirellulaceae bacterium]|jgi:spore coat polysaccharide biosynthesis protein SpsF|nr:NTP transferase domain-containing protein [Pirellulaceae bacterium]MDP7019163.1 NTP transferase domain-containing protein [Pirellulaceae bacterium]
MPNSSNVRAVVAGLEAAAVVVCRLDSARLPGKVLREVGGRPLLAWVVDRLRRANGLDRGVIVATSDRPVDDPIEQFCRRQDIAVFRGATYDVAYRVLSCATAYELKWFARVNADSPFVDAELIDRACAAAVSDQYDLITNLHPRTFPYGVSVELIRLANYESAYRRMCAPEHFEHVTKILYEPDFACRRLNLTRAGSDLSGARLTVDTPADWQVFQQLAEHSIRHNTSLSYLDAVRLQQPAKEAA